MRWRRKAGRLLPAEPEAPEQTFEVPAELDPDEDVEHGVEAAVGEGHVAADEQGVIQLLADFAALNDPQFQQCLQEQDQVVGSPAEEVRRHDGEDEPDGAVAPFGPWAEQGPEDLHVAEQDDPHGQQEDDVVLVDGGEEPLEFRIVTARREHLVEDGIGDRGQDAGCPHGGRHQHAALEGVDAQGRDGTHHRQVAMDGHDGQEGDAAVEADGEDHVEELAQEVSQHPAPVVPQDPHGQQAGEHQVWEAQVEDEDVGEGLQALILHQDPQHQAVAHQAEKEHQAVQDGSADGGEDKGPLLTQKALRIILIRGGGLRDVWGLHLDAESIWSDRDMEFKATWLG